MRHDTVLNVYIEIEQICELKCTYTYYFLNIFKVRNRIHAVEIGKSKTKRKMKLILL